MGTLPQYFIVESKVLPDVILRTAQAKRLLEAGEVKTVNEAVHRVGISRSAFYKYKDAVRPFNDMLRDRIVTFQILLKNEPGILSAVLNIFAGSGVNILTINQGLPAGSSAVVSISAETSGMATTMEDLLSRTAEEPGVVRCEILAG